MTKKIVILVLGNMAAGKTAFACALAQQLTGFQVLCLDDYREAAGGIGMAREHLAVQNFLADAETVEKIIYETTAFGKTYAIAKRLFSKANAKVITFKLNCSPETCHSRFQVRNKHPPFPYTFNLWDSLWRIHANLKTLKGHELDSESFSTQELIAQVL